MGKDSKIEWCDATFNQCTEARVAFFYKQIGNMDSAGMRRKDGHYRELDGRTWDEYPEVKP